MKPLNAPEPGTRVWVKGFKAEAEDGGEGGGVVEWAVDFPSGFHDVLRLILRDLVRGLGEVCGRWR